MKKQEKRRAVNPLIFVAGIIIGVLVLRFALINRFLFFLILIAGAFGALGYILYKIVADYQQRKQFARSSGGRFDQRTTICRDQIDRLKKELQEIENSIAELQNELEKPVLKNASTLTRLENLLASFQNEKALREAKIKFYETCLNKLETLQHNRKLVEQLAEKTHQLKQLRENRYEEMADMEAFKTQLAFDEGFFETMDELSIRIQKTESLAESENLQKELEIMTKEI